MTPVQEVCLKDAIEYLKGSTSVQDWNERRSIVYDSFKVAFGYDAFHLPEWVEAIDGADRETGVSLIVRTLGSDEGYKMSK